jgi:nucleoside-diphosphate-sugar epimerase
MKILLTGSTGFLGRPLAAQLSSAGHQLVLPTRADCGPLEAMTADAWRPWLEDVEAVIHAAAIAHIGRDVPSSRYDAVNRDASAVLARASAAARVKRFVFISSIRAQVGPTSSFVQSETTTPEPKEPYGRSKLAAERLISEAFPEATHLRPPLVIGGEPKANLALMARLAASPLPLPFGRFDAPQAVVALDNLMDAISIAVSEEALTGQAFVMAEEPHPSLADMLRWMREGRGRSPLLIPVPGALLRLPAAMLGKGDAFDRLTGGLRVDSSRIRAAGWQPRSEIADVFRALGASSR